MNANEGQFFALIDDLSVHCFPYSDDNVLYSNNSKTMPTMQRAKPNKPTGHGCCIVTPHEVKYADRMYPGVQSFVKQKSQRFV